MRPTTRRDARNPFTEILALQGEFQTRLAEETMRYIRRLQGALAPTAPGTVVDPDAPMTLVADGVSGGQVELHLEAENRQRVHTLATLRISPLVDGSGRVWFPETDPAVALIAPGDTKELVLPIEIPKTLAPGAYRGAAVLDGLRDHAIPVTVQVKAAQKTRTKTTSREPSAKRTPARRKTPATRRKRGRR